jgi:hypothetical protein
MMFYRWKTRWKRNSFEGLTRGILDTRPMPVVDAPWSIVSMVSNNDVQMYLLSLKSFYRRIKRGKIIAIVDRDMPNELQSVITRHFPGIHLAVLEDIETGPCQRGGTWERLIYLLDHARNEYVIQVDCDTLTFGDIPQVLNCVESNIPFTLRGAGRDIMPMPEAAALARAQSGDYIGTVAERLFDRYPNAGALKYVCASSGFAGFSCNGFASEQIMKFHETMEEMLGARWKEWGTEQCASNFAIANSPNAIVLPSPQYANFGPETVRGQGSFLHFIGTYRYLDDYFATLGLAEIAALNGGSSRPAGDRGMMSQPGSTA